jgi:hypothetical protein
MIYLPVLIPPVVDIVPLTIMLAIILLAGVCVARVLIEDL